jgi:hypothetical protein
MVNLGKVHKGDKNTDFRLLVENTDITNTNSPVNLALVNTIQIIFTDPDEVETTVTATIVNPPGSDGIISYVNSDATFIDQGGFWYYRAKLTYISGSIYQSNDAEFEVLDKPI